MLLPIGDVPNPKTTPYVNWLLMGINIAVFMAVTLPLSAARPDLNDPALLEYLNLIGARGDWSAQLVYSHISAYDLAVFKDFHHILQHRSNPVRGLEKDHGLRLRDQSFQIFFTAARSVRDKP